MTPDEILRKHEDANEMHFHEVDRKFIIEAMEEYAKVCHNSSNISDKQQTAVQWLKSQLAVTHSPEIIEWLWDKALQMERKHIIDSYKHGQNNGYMYRDGNGNIIEAEQYYTEIYQSNEE